MVVEIELPGYRLMVKITEKVLFVDDDPNVLSSMQRRFKKNINLATATSGKQALEILDNEGPFAVVISDMRIP